VLSVFPVDDVETYTDIIDHICPRVAGLATECKRSSDALDLGPVRWRPVSRYALAIDMSPVRVVGSPRALALTCPINERDNRRRPSIVYEEDDDDDMPALEEAQGADEAAASVHAMIALCTQSQASAAEVTPSPAATVPPAVSTTTGATFASPTPGAANTDLANVMQDLVSGLVPVATAAECDQVGPCCCGLSACVRAAEQHGCCADIAHFWRGAFVCAQRSGNSCVAPSVWCHVDGKRLGGLHQCGAARRRVADCEHATIVRRCRLLVVEAILS
jgi:hypothetical protein